MSKKGETKRFLVETYIRSLTSGTVITSSDVAKKINLNTISAGHYMRNTGLVKPIRSRLAGNWVVL